MEINRTQYRILLSFILSLLYILICRVCRKKSSCNMCDEFRLNWHTTATTGSPPVNTASSSLNARPGQVIVSSLVDQEVYAVCTCDHAWVTLHLHVKPLYGARCQGSAACVVLREFLITFVSAYGALKDGVIHKVLISVWVEDVLELK